MPSMTKNAEAQLDLLWREIADLSSAEAVLGWDQETMMPAKGQIARGRALGTLAAVKHAKLTASALQDAVAVCEEEAEVGSVLEAKAREARRQVDRACKIPTALAKALAEGTSAGLVADQKIFQVETPADRITISSLLLASNPRPVRQPISAANGSVS